MLVLTCGLKTLVSDVVDERVPLTLRFERAGEIQVELRVQSADSKKPQH